jgi:hypothetical protein
VATWYEKRRQGETRWTSPEFEGYDIEHPEQTIHYIVWSPAGYLGNRPSFKAAEQLVIKHAELVASAAPEELAMFSNELNAAEEFE